MSAHERALAIHRAAESGTDEASGRLREALTDPDLLVRVTAAIRMTEVVSEPLPEGLVRDMLSMALAAVDDAPIANDYARLTADEGTYRNLQQEIVQALGRLPSGSADYAIAPLLDLWRRDRQFFEAVLTCLSLAFPECGAGKPLSRSGSLQLATLRALAGDDPIWRNCGDLAEMLNARGLPTNRRELQNLLHDAGATDAH